jgi:hypothetical protein
MSAPPNIADAPKSMPVNVIPALNPVPAPALPKENQTGKVDYPAVPPAYAPYVYLSFSYLL